jgi:hypothetical protein
MTDKIKDRIEKISNEESLSNWERNFLESLFQQAGKGHNLSHRQNNTLQNIESKYSEDKKAALHKWKEEYTPEMREKMVIMASYYLNNPPYFQDLARRVLDEEVYIPTEKAFRAMCENKYAVRVINIIKTDPIYAVGSMVRIRSNADGNASRYRNKMVMVLEHDATKLASAAKNARPVYVIPVGAAQPFWTEERYLKKVKKTG